MSVGEQAGAPAAPEPDRAHGVNPWLVLVLVSLGQFMVILDATLAADKTASSHADPATALVDGFHVAFAGPAILMLAGVVMLAALVRKEDVANVR
jgi:hypothetical protein